MPPNANDLPAYRHKVSPRADIARGDVRDDDDYSRSPREYVSMYTPRRVRVYV